MNQNNVDYLFVTIAISPDIFRENIEKFRIVEDACFQKYGNT
jgi:hypothetical protein